MSHALPDPIARYFDGVNARDADAASAAFAADAVVHDEGHDHVGRVAIRSYLQHEIDTYSAHFAIDTTAQTPESILVTATVSGTFANSPLRLRFTFQLADGAVTRLDIEP